MNAAILGENNIVVNVVASTEEFALLMGWIPLPEGSPVTMGWIYDPETGEFSEG